MGLYQLTILNRNAVKLQDRRLQYDRSNPLHSRDVWGMRNTAGKKNDGLEDKYPDVEFREVDIQTDLETSEEYGVRKTPTTLVYANGKQTAEFHRYRRAERPRVSHRARDRAVVWTRPTSRRCRSKNNDHQTNSNHMTNYNRRQFLEYSVPAQSPAQASLSQ